MLFLSRWARPAAKEWFTLLEWMLILSAVAFAAKKNPQSLYQVALYVSFGVLWCYLMVGYQALWHDYLRAISPLPTDDSFRTYIPTYRHVQNGICFRCWGSGIDFPLFFASRSKP